MKSIKLTAKIKALLQAADNTPPQSSAGARAFFGEVTGLCAADWETHYLHSVSSYIATPKCQQQKNAHLRRLISKVLFAFLTIRGTEKKRAAAITEQTIYKQQYARFSPAVLTAMQRARARKLTPVGRGYRTAIGIEIEGISPLSREDLAERLPLFTKVIYDGSIEQRGAAGTTAEVVALLNRDEMEPRLHRLCSRLNQLNFSTNKSCGLHVHIDCRHLSFEEVCGRAKIMDKWIKSLVELLPLSRRDNRYAKLGFSRTDRYRAINVTSYQKHQTLEVRIHSSTASYQKVLAWVRLCEMLFSLRKAPKAALGCIAALDQLPLADYERSYWKARHIQLNPAQYQGAVVSSTGGEE